MHHFSPKIFHTCVLLCIIVANNIVSGAATVAKPAPAPAPAPAPVKKGSETTTRKKLNTFDYKFINNPEYNICEKANASEDVDLLIYVHSSPSYLKRRLTIRETWAQRALFPRIRLIFVLGTPNEPNLKELNRLESQIYGDVVQADFLDTYKNLTLKGVMAIQWIHTYCPHAKFILKTDDDVIVNTFLMLSNIERMIKHKTIPKKRITCAVWKKSRPDRKKNSKWYVTHDEYPEKTYPQYCAGFFFLMTNDVIEPLHEEIFYTRYFWIDDVWLTGLAIKNLNVTLECRKDAIVEQATVVQRFIDPKTVKQTFGGHLGKSASKITTLWNYLPPIYLSVHSVEDINEEYAHRFLTIHKKLKAFYY